MKIALVLFRWFPHGGMQRDCVAIARRLAARGHAVTILVGEWEGGRPEGIAVKVLGHEGLSNHARNRRFAARAMARFADYDRVVGLDRMPGLDIYYAADRCFALDARAKGPWFKLTPRYRVFAGFERAVFARDGTTRALLLHEGAKRDYQAAYGTPDSRLHVLGPAIARNRVRPKDADAIRATTRAEMGLGDDEFAVLLVASRYRTKGLDRAIDAMAGLARGTRAALVLIGADDLASYARQAESLGVRLIARGARDDVVRHMVACDLMFHPARADNTGTVILEAMACGLPVICSGVCGYATHVRAGDCGAVLGEPYDPGEASRTLATALDRATLARWSANALAYVARTDIHGGIDEAVRLIETI